MYDGNESYDSLSPIERIIVELVKYSGSIKPTRLQKLSLLVKASIDGKLPTTHSAYLFGGFSDDVDEGSEAFRAEGVLSYTEGTGYSLTEFGKKVTGKVSSQDPDLSNNVERIVKMFSHLKDKEVTAATYVLFPQLTEQSLIKDEMQKVASKLNLMQIKLDTENP